jgi:hypothetical protein
MSVALVSCCCSCFALTMSLSWLVAERGPRGPSQPHPPTIMELFPRWQSCSHHAVKRWKRRCELGTRGGSSGWQPRCGIDMRACMRAHHVADGMRKT